MAKKTAIEVLATDWLSSMNATFDSLFADANKKLLTTTVKQELTVKTGSSYRVTSDDKVLILEVDLPGVAAADVDLSHLGNQAIVTGKRGDKDFKATYTVSSDYDLRYATASMANGQLRVRVPKGSAPKPVAIHIEVS